MYFSQGKFNKKEYLRKNRKRMKEAGDICVISIPFVAGIVLSALLKSPFICSSIFLLLAAVLLLTVVCSRRDCRIQTAILYFCIGAFCHSSAALRGSGTSNGMLHSAFVPMLREYMISMPFSDESTPKLLCALLSGDRSGVGRDIISAFRNSGASHILALSGLHLGVIYSIIVRISSFAGRARKVSFIRSLTIILICGTYSAAAGWSPSIVRAFLFISLNEISKLQPGRIHSPVSVFFVVLMLQLIVSPLAICTIGFQLSYLAVLGIVFIFPVLERFYPGSGKYDPIHKIWSSAALSISCQLTTAPVVWIYFQTFPKYFLLTNLISLPLAELVILTALAATVSYAVLPSFTAPVTICEQCTQALVYCLNVISSM